MNFDLSTRINSAIKLAINNEIDDTLLLQLIEDFAPYSVNQNLAHQFLELAHFSNVCLVISNSSKIEEWFSFVTRVIEVSNYHFGFMLRQRCSKYSEKVALNIVKDNSTKAISYSQLWSKTVEVTKSLIAFNDKTKINVGILSNNNLNTVLVDFSCLSFGLRVIPVPLNSTAESLSYILEHAEINLLFVGGKKGVLLLSQIDLDKKISVINLDNIDDVSKKLGYQTWETFLKKGDSIEQFDIDSYFSNIDINSINTIMYTSGTTDYPKGIIFTQKNIITKRFARALALPNINSNDVFLCYLPLFHTFGRFFELMGSIFWGATYSFAESPAFNSLLRDFQAIKPTIFISIPKRWVQLYEMLQTKIDLDKDDKKIIQNVLKEITGARLKLGLSAAGYLDPDIFKTFQHYGINLLSGYGMTEATGGITMTPQNNYVENSVGKALPGIELKLEEDGEMCLKGPYISQGYFKDQDSNVFKNGWFHTQDIFRKEQEHYFIIDRKKDIYKNSRGQTIAPQKIENLFQDFESIKSVFLVGDGQEYNTVLIFPDYENAPRDLKKASNQTIRDLFSSMILSVNGFLSSYERIVNYVIINRDFSFERDELTAKSTYKRKNILENFKNIITPLYEKNYISLHYNSKELRIPNWLLREIGTLRTNLKWDGILLSINEQKIKLNLSWNNDRLKIGDFTYKIANDIFDVESFIQEPRLWLGNFQFSNFIGNSIFRLKEPRKYDTVDLIGPKSGTSFATVKESEKIDNHLYKLHKIVRDYLCDDPYVFINLSKLIDNDLDIWNNVALETFGLYQSHSNAHFRLKFIESIAPILTGDFLISVLHEAYKYHIKVSPLKVFTLNTERLNDQHYEAFILFLKTSYATIKENGESEQDFIKIIILMVADYGVIHPTKFVWTRSELISWQLSNIPKPIFSTAQKAYYTLVNGFRSWIGKSSNLTIDPETGNEYTWDEVIQFDESLRTSQKKILLNVINKTSVIRESIFLFSKNYIIGLNDIPLNGIWITHIETRNKKSVFRILIRTRTFGTHNIILNLNEGLPKDFLDAETKLLIKMSAGLNDSPLVENFGGYWPEYGIYTEEYVQGETVSQYLSRNMDDIQDKSKMDRWQMRWLHFIWNGIQAYQEFWRRSNYEFSIQPPSIDNLIIPEHDYKVGTRLISISSRSKVQSIAEHFITLYTDYIVATEQKFPGLKKMADWEVIFTATIQALKVEDGKRILLRLKSEIANSIVGKKALSIGLTESRIDQFLVDTETSGILTKPVVFASLRYERWLELNQNATLAARATILQELYSDYNLDHLLNEYPETRVRFFMMNCFKNANKELLSGFQKIIQDIRKKELSPWNLQERITKIERELSLNEEEKFFLARMLFPHVDAADYVELVSTKYGKEEKLNLVYQTECKDGNLYRIRPPFIPKEIAHFHTILLESSLNSTFTSEHEFLLAFNNRNRIAGGLYWRKIDSKKIHLEWVAIRQKYQKISLSNRLMSDFFKRKKHQGIHTITVGFYAEKFFFKQGFKIDKQFGGLVKRI